MTLARILKFQISWFLYNYTYIPPVHKRFLNRRINVVNSNLFRFFLFFRGTAFYFLLFLLLILLRYQFFLGQSVVLNHVLFRLVFCRGKRWSLKLDRFCTEIRVANLSYVKTHGASLRVVLSVEMVFRPAFAHAPRSAICCAEYYNYMNTFGCKNLWFVTTVADWGGHTRIASNIARKLQRLCKLFTVLFNLHVQPCVKFHWCTGLPVYSPEHSTQGALHLILRRPSLFCIQAW